MPKKHRCLHYRKMIFPLNDLKTLSPSHFLDLGQVVHVMSFIILTPNFPNFGNHPDFIFFFYFVWVNCLSCDHDTACDDEISGTVDVSTGRPCRCVKRVPFPVLYLPWTKHKFKKISSINYNFKTNKYNLLTTKETENIDYMYWYVSAFFSSSSVIMSKTRPQRKRVIACQWFPFILVYRLLLYCVDAITLRVPLRTVFGTH